MITSERNFCDINVFNLEIFKNPYLSDFNLAVFRKFWNKSHLIFAISRTETLANLNYYDDNRTFMW